MTPFLAERGLEQLSPATREMVSWLPLPLLLAGEGRGEGVAAAQECSTTTELTWTTGTVSVQFGTSATMAAGQILLDRISYAIQNSFKRRF
jgi:hypothetical protein